MPDDPQYRSLHTHAPDEVTLRESEEVEEEEGMMEIRLPIASTGEVRNEGDDPLTDAELRGMARQVDSLTRGVFPEHGMSNAVDADTYSQFEKLGYWASADIERDGASDDNDLLMATARMPDPETLPAATGDYREALAILKEQALRGIPISSSVAWRDDEDAPGGVDLMEASLVGIGADPRTSSEGGEQLVARAAIEAGADPQELVDTVQSVAREYGDGGDGDDDSDADAERPLGPPGDRDRFDTFDECVATLSEDDDVSEADAEQICGAWENASSADTPDDTHDMTDTDTPPDEDEGGTDSTEQDADDPIQQALDTLAEREVSLDSLVPLVADATGADESAVEDALDDLQATDEDGDGDDNEEDDEEMDDDNEEDEDEDEEQSADTGDGDGRSAELDERLDKIEDDLADLRNGEIQAADPEAVAEELRSEFDLGDEGDDAEDDGDEAERDTTDPAAKPEWATQD